MIKKRGIVLVLVVLLLAVSVAAFNVNSLFLKVSVNKNEAVNRMITLSSVTGDDFSLTTNIPGVSVAEETFQMLPGEKNVDVLFDSAQAEPGVHVGELLIASTSETVIVPVIFEVESQDVFFDATISIPPQYSDIAVGGKLVSQIKIFDLVSGGLGGALDVEYIVYDNKGQVVHFETERVSVERQLQLSKSISFPEHVKVGNYVYAVVARYKSSVGVSTHLFSVSSDEIVDQTFFDKEFLVVLVVILGFFSLLIVLFVYLIHDRDKFILALRRHHTSELKVHKGFLAAQVKFIRKKGEHPLRREIRKNVRALKAKHRRQLHEMRRLKYSGELKRMREKLRAWKRAGYNTLGLEYRMGGLTSKEMKNLLKKMKMTYGRTEEYKKKK